MSLRLTPSDEAALRRAPGVSPVWRLRRRHQKSLHEPPAHQQSASRAAHGFSRGLHRRRVFKRADRTGKVRGGSGRRYCWLRVDLLACGLRRNISCAECCFWTVVALGQVAGVNPQNETARKGTE
jgi:hypothetical protein